MLLVVHVYVFPLNVKLSMGFNPFRYRSGGKRIGHPTSVVQAISEIGAHHIVPQSLIFIGQVYVKFCNSELVLGRVKGLKFMCIEYNKCHYGGMYNVYVKEFLLLQVYEWTLLRW